MKLRSILVVLSLMAFLSVLTAGYLYYASSQKKAFQEADRQASLYTETIKNHLSLFLSQNLKSVKALAGMKELRRILMDPGAERLGAANALLDHFQTSLDADVCYIMSRNGMTIASSNRDAPDSFVGKNYAFRPYFQQAMRGQPSLYLARGITSKRRGIYCSFPVLGSAEADQPIGVVVIKSPIGPLENEFSQAYEGIVTLVDPHGVNFLCNRKDWLYQFLWKPSPEAIQAVAESRQFGRGPWSWTGLEMKEQGHAADLSGNEFALYRADIPSYPGWQVVYLQDIKLISKKVSVTLLKMTGLVVATGCAFIGLLILFLYRKASHLIARRRAAEEALRESEETALALLNAPTEGALLLDTQGAILALNRLAADGYGKTPGELIGRCAFELFSPDVAATRKAHHEWVVRSGKPFRYEDRRENCYFNTNLYPVFDTQGKVVRVAVFSRDVTSQKRAEEGLRLAKEELTRYSRELEKRVKNRTREITSILKYTPAAVFIKDKEGCYSLVNSKFEQLFGLKQEQIQGKTAQEVFAEKFGDRFHATDQQVLQEGRSSQEEIRIPLEDGLYTYLSIKFPLYDEAGQVSGLCGIATDITALKKAQDQLKRLSASIMSSQEKERAAIARELHDELGQMLTALRIDAVWISNRLKENDPKAAERTLDMCRLIDKTIDEVRGMAVRLRPGVLDDLGLIPALEWYTCDFEKRTGIACRFKQMNVSHVDRNLATAAYRIAQEALTNVARHALAVQVDVTLERHDGLLTLAVSDDGRGFDADEFSDGEYFGIAGMHERADLVGGTIEIRSKPEEGTIVFFRAPLHGQKG